MAYHGLSARMNLRKGVIYTTGGKKKDLPA